MRSSTAFNLAVLASILLPEPSLATIKLSQFQAISGFSDDCTAAYDSPVKECDSSDFKDGNSCSSDCVTALTTLQTTINSACQGSRAEPGTLIALFFEDEGVSTLCPNIVVKSTAASSTTSIETTSTSIETSTSASVTVASSTSSSTVITSSTSTSLQPFPPVTLTTSTSTTTASTSSSSSTTSTSTTTTSSSTISSSRQSTTTSSSSSTTTAKVASTLSITKSESSSEVTTSEDSKSTAAGFTTTVFNDGFASTITSKAEQTEAAKSNPEAFGGGGSPFEVGPNGSGGEKRIRGSSMFTAILIMLIASLLMARGLP